MCCCIARGCLSAALRLPTWSSSVYLVQSPTHRIRASHGVLHNSSRTTDNAHGIGQRASGVVFVLGFVASPSICCSPSQHRVAKAFWGGILVASGYRSSRSNACEACPLKPQPCWSERAMAYCMVTAPAALLAW
ncbi:hypothetical protein HDV63DRAFT_258250 [Trichoderma sp. SZMC 28014]